MRRGVEGVTHFKKSEEKPRHVRAQAGSLWGWYRGGTTALARFPQTMVI